MKKLIYLFTFLFLQSNLISAQEIQSFYFGLGVNAAYAPLSGLNNVLRHYQNVRSYLDPKLSSEGESYINNISDINVLLGPSISIGYMFKPEFNFEFKYMDRKNGITSQVLDLRNNVIRRDFKFISKTYGFGISRLFSTGRTDYIIGGTLNMTNIRLETKNIIDPEPVNQTQFGSTIFMKYIFNFSETSPLAIVINPYYQYHFTNGEFSQLNRIINPNTANLLSSDNVMGSRSYFGLELQLNYFVFTGFNKEPIKE